MSNPMDELDRAKLTAESLNKEFKGESFGGFPTNGHKDALELAILNTLISIADSLKLFEETL